MFYALPWLLPSSDRLDHQLASQSLRSGANNMLLVLVLAGWVGIGFATIAGCNVAQLEYVCVHNSLPGVPLLVFLNSAHTRIWLNVQSVCPYSYHRLLQVKRILFLVFKAISKELLLMVTRKQPWLLPSVSVRDSIRRSHALCRLLKLLKSAGAGASSGGNTFGGRTLVSSGSDSPVLHQSLDAGAHTLQFDPKYISPWLLRYGQTCGLGVTFGA